MNQGAAPGLWRRTPPAIFPPIFGLMGLGLAWRRAEGVFGVPAAVAELILGMVTLLYLFALLAYLAKMARRPGVLAEDLRILPGRAGLAAMTLSILLFAAVLERYDAGAARVMLFAGLATHGGLAVMVIRALLTGPAEQRRVTPVFHLSFVGFILAPLTAVPLGYTGLSEWVVYLTGAAAVLIWGESLRQFAAAGVPAPLRPLLAIHLAPACLLGTAALLLGWTGLATGFAWLSLALVALFAASARWITAAGFSPLWGAFTFPLAAFASLMLLMAGYVSGGAFRAIAGVALVAATLVIPPIVVKTMQLWAKGQLAVKTNAATA
jgi:tellurite resistance protein